ncbi:MAG: allantoinase AllB [Chitinophagaceae bacterium]
MDLAIKSNRVVTPQEVRPATVLIRDGRIADIINISDTGIDCEIIDLEDKALLPGLTDPHVHLNEPGRTDWEGFDTATRSAITGGLTMLVDMPLNSSPVTTDAAAFEKKLSATQNQLHANCGFWGGIIPGNEKEIVGLIEKGVLGFKTFLAHSGIDDFPNSTEADLRIAMPIIAKYDLPLLAHCELVAGNGEKKIGDPRSYQKYLRSRPASWEDNAITLMIRLSEEYNCRVHIVHLSSSGSINQIKKAKARGVKITVETAQHYLYFNAETIGDGQTQFKCAPPIRNKANNALLWEALAEGTIDFVATDHSPAPPALKHLQSGDFTKAWGGIASLQFALPVLWTIARKQNVSLNYIAQWLSEKPAILTGTHNGKGRIAKGYDADLTVFDTEKKFLVTEEMIQHKHKITPYLGQELYGVVEQTFLGGVKVFDKGIFTRLNQGKIIIR